MDSKKRHFKLYYLITITLILSLFTGCSTTERSAESVSLSTTDYNMLSDAPMTDVTVKQQVSTEISGKDADKKANKDAINEVSVHFIDVGQADSIFIDYGDVDILIDGGNNDDGELVVNYLKSLGTDDIELLVATHPHEDHIGGLDTVIYNFDVEKILKPFLSENSKTSRDFEEAIRSRNIPAENPAQGEVIELGDLKFVVLSDKTKNYSETNNYSIVLKMIYGDTSFLFTGDAEADVEHDILESGLDIKADVLKVGHHGSASSTTAAFLKKVSPDYAVISVGTDNKYGHPDPIIINRLNLQDVATMQTNEMGTIVFTSNGTNLTFKTSKEINAQTGAVTGKTETGTNKTVAKNTGKGAVSGETSESGAQSSGPETPDVVISSLDKKAEFVEITNRSGKNIDLTGWYIVSVTGNQTFRFPEGFILEAGKTVKISSAGAAGDLQWSAGNIWNNSSSDPAELYNASGVLIHRWDD